MSDLFKKWGQFQDMLEDRKEVMKLLNSGPVWLAQTRSQASPAPTCDRIEEWARKEFHERMTASRGKAASIHARGTNAVMHCSRTQLSKYNSQRSRLQNQMARSEKNVVDKESNTASARGQFDLEQLEMKIGVREVMSGKQMAEATVHDIRVRNSSARDKPLVHPRLGIQVLTNEI